MLLGSDRVRDFLSGAPRVKQLMEALPPEHAHVILCLPALGQAHVFANLPEGTNLLLMKQVADIHCLIFQNRYGLVACWVLNWWVAWGFH